MPDWVNLSCCWVLWVRCFCKVLFVRYAIFMSECLKIFVMNVVCLPMYVKVHHFFLFRGFCGCELWLSRGFWTWRFFGCELWLSRGFWICIGKELLYSILWIMFFSCWCSLSCRWYEFSLLYKNLTAAYFCCVGWFEVYGMRVSVYVGFLKTVSHFVFQFLVVIDKPCILLRENNQYYIWAEVSYSITPLCISITIS